jgi:hypothetical protein
MLADGVDAGQRLCVQDRNNIALQERKNNRWRAIDGKLTSK